MIFFIVLILVHVFVNMFFIYLTQLNYIKCDLGKYYFQTSFLIRFGIYS